MPDEPPPPPPASDSPKSTGLPSNIAAALACIPLIGGIVFFILEKQDPFVRFYSMQSIVFGLAWFLFNVVSAIVHAIFGAIPAIGGILVFFWAIVAAIVQIAFVVLWIIATVKAFTGVRWDIPYVGPIARKQVGEASCLCCSGALTAPNLVIPGSHRPSLQLLPEQLHHHLRQNQFVIELRGDELEIGGETGLHRGDQL